MNLKLDKYLLLFESCRLTKGVSRTLLYDHQRNKIEFLDNVIYEIFTNHNKNKSLGAILSLYHGEDREAVIEYIIFLIQNEYVFYSEKEEVSFFPSLDTKWDDPSIITNCIIDFSSIPKDVSVYYKVFEELDALGCENLQIRDFYGLSVDFLNELFEGIYKTAIHRVELLLKSNNELSDIQAFLLKFPIVREVTIHSAWITKEMPTKTGTIFQFTEQKITDENCCGIVAINQFNLNWNHYLESKNYNSCLNRKLSIDKFGNIKNCPSLKTSYGDISTTSIIDAVNNKDFSKIWNIKKEDIADCKVCEFRHVCTDCRAYLKTDLSFEKPAKCNYNPYTMEWA
ncbi:grasp-with-spasm system SPASM domain peptide maturase [Tenacibaculum sp. nBUS_03]|uniref:grasp-with-spasm system SPASM domain peptide maturase n=1 Tax=Tenacibaculum sp. nBUS_03 TaxID=3395320 RepID=UPI003EB9EF7F